MPALREAITASFPMMSCGPIQRIQHPAMGRVNPRSYTAELDPILSTYSGFHGESKLLWDLYRQAVSNDEHPEGQGERIHPDLPIYANREARLFAYWDHEPRMPWQTQEYYDSQKKTLRPGTYLRLHENQWAAAEETFITPEMWDPCVDSFTSSEHNRP